MAARCPESDPKLSDIMIEPWQNFDGEHGAYKAHLIEMGVPAAPAHARLEITHRCGWALTLTPGPHSAHRVFVEIAEHLGATPPETAMRVAEHSKEG